MTLSSKPLVPAATALTFLAALPWAYTASLLAWFALRILWGDRLWWSALAASFTPFFFLPLLILLPAVLFTSLRQAPGLRLALFIPAAMFALLYGRLFLPRRAHLAAPEAAFTVMTFNMWGGSRSAETARVIAEAGYPDIVALQEVRLRMVPLLEEEVGAAYPHRLLLLDHPLRGLALLSRVPLEPVASPDLTALERCEVQAVRAAMPQGPVILYNVHPRSSNILRYLRKGEPIVEATRQSFAQRMACMEAVVADSHRHSEPVIVLGDFNATDRHDTYRMLHASLRDAHRDAGWGFGHTYPAAGGSHRGIPYPPRQVRIDMVLYSDALHALSCHVSAAHGESNHRPVIARLAWRQQHTQPAEE